MNLTDTELKQITATVSSLLINLGDTLAKTFNHFISSEEKTSPHDLVTKYDKEMEEALFNHLKKLYPQFGFHGEEGGARLSDETAPFWMVDPIDGTLNFANSIPAFAISVALISLGKSYVGVCYNPITKELFSAYRGGGAFLNGHKISPSSNKKFDHSILALPPDQLYKKKGKFVVRRQGASVLDICYVAKGATDGFYDPCLNPWDFAAASLIAEEAGAEITSLVTKTLDTNKKSDILVANKNIARELAKWILMDER